MLWYAQSMNKNIALSHQSFTAPIAIAFQIKRTIQLISFLIGSKTATQTNTKIVSLDPSLSYITKDYFKTLLVTTKNY
jgi:hypothetical protein